MRKLANKQKLALRREVVRSLGALDFDQMRRAGGGAKSSVNYEEDCTTTSVVFTVCSFGTCHFTQ